MKNKFTEELITAYLDNEIKDAEELRKFQSMLSEDPSLDFDIKAAAMTKELVKKKNLRKNAPGRLRENILKNISEASALRGKRNFISAKIYSQKFIAYSTAGVILIAVLLLLFNRPNPTTNNISRQTGNNNMLVMAESYFENFLSGNNTPQFISNSADDIKNFFQAQGVKFAAYIPSYKDYSLAGASVIELNGVKLAHHIYAGKNGKFIYVFQVHESCFEGDSIIRLTNDLLNYIKDGHDYKTRRKDYVTILQQKKENILAVVSNLPDNELPEDIYK